METFLTINFIIAFILCNIGFFLIKKTIISEKFKFRKLFFHGSNIKEFVFILNSEKNANLKKKYENILKLFKFSLYYLIIAAILLIIIKLYPMGQV